MIVIPVETEPELAPVPVLVGTIPAPRQVEHAEANCQTEESELKPIPIHRVSTESQAYLPNEISTREIVARDQSDKPGARPSASAVEN
jgi:hypothetical protein